MKTAALRNRPLSVGTAATLALTVLLLAGPGHAGSSASSEVSGSVSASVGSSSASISGSSDSSTGQRVAAGEYRIVSMTDAAPRADGRAQRLLQLQALADATPAGSLRLTLPAATAAQAALAPGVVVLAQTRPYGTAFSTAADQRTFFLALDDASWRDLDSRLVRL